MNDSPSGPAAVPSVPPTVPSAAPFPDTPSPFVTSRDGTRIAVFSAGDGPAIVLVHGTTSDHRTWRTVAPGLAGRHALHAIDRRGRGDSGDGPAYQIERELEDLAAVADEVAAETGRPVDVVGHSLGGRIALGASLLTPNVRHLDRAIWPIWSTSRLPGRPVRRPARAGRRPATASWRSATFRAPAAHAWPGTSPPLLDPAPPRLATAGLHRVTRP